MTAPAGVVLASHGTGLDPHPRRLAWSLYVARRFPDAGSLSHCSCDEDHRHGFVIPTHEKSFVKVLSLPKAAFLSQLTTILCSFHRIPVAHSHRPVYAPSSSFLISTCSPPTVVTPRRHCVVVSGWHKIPPSHACSSRAMQTASHAWVLAYLMQHDTTTCLQYIKRNVCSHFNCLHALPSTSNYSLLLPDVVALSDLP